MKIGRKMYHINLTVLMSRLFLLSLVMIVYIGLMHMTGNHNTNSTAAAYTGPTTTVTVKEGDSLWRIASSLNDGSTDTRDMVDSIMRINSLDTADLKPGHTLVIPDTRTSVVAERTSANRSNRDQS